MALSWKSNGFTNDITFLIRHKNDCPLRTKTLTLDGPLGKDLRLQKYENVMLAAKGIGVTGVLPHALSLAQRRQHDNEAKKSESGKVLYRDNLRKVNLFWKLEDNSGQEWIGQQLSDLQKLDPANVGLDCW